MTFAVLKLSYNSENDTQVEGGICGTGFFVNSHQGVTAHHVLNGSTFVPNPGFKACVVFLLTRDGVRHIIQEDAVCLLPEIDVSTINIDDNGGGFYPLQTTKTKIGEKVRGIGHIGNQMPQIDALWENSKLDIKSFNLSSAYSDNSGSIIDSNNMQISSKDVNLNNVFGYELSFGSRVGMSGGPVLVDNSAIGMMSFGLPVNSHIKDRTFVISSTEILDRI